MPSGHAHKQLTYPVAIARSGAVAYPTEPPYHPDQDYPESPFREGRGPSNPVYGAVRNLFNLLGLDAKNAGSECWNPLGAWVRPGDKVFIKPNMIAHKHAHNEDWDHVITHGAVLRAVTDFVFIALRGEGAITIGDAPQTDSHFNLIIERMGLPALQAWYHEQHRFAIEVLDLRDMYWVEHDGIYTDTVTLPGDPCGRVEVDLAERSQFAEFDGRGRHYYGAFYDTEETGTHHRDGKHEYAISRTPIESDVFISVPKLKTHKKCGLTVNLKGLVGINADKNWLPHYCIGSPVEGGDQFPGNGRKGKWENRIVLGMKKHLVRGNPLAMMAARRLKQLGYRIFGDTEEVVRSGNWHGNDTVWRMSIDLNRILMYANPDGTLRPADQPKRFFSVVDGIVAMEGNGPVAGTPRSTGIVAAGDNPVAVDAICARVMGLDPEKIPLIRRCLDPHPQPLFEGDFDDLRPCSNHSAWGRPWSQWRPEESFRFRPHFGWVGHVEWAAQPETRK